VPLLPTLASCGTLSTNFLDRKPVSRAVFYHIKHCGISPPALIFAPPYL